MDDVHGNILKLTPRAVALIPLLWGKLGDTGADLNVAKTAALSPPGDDLTEAESTSITGVGRIVYRSCG